MDRDDNSTCNCNSTLHRDALTFFRHSSCRSLIKRARKHQVRAFFFLPALWCVGKENNVLLTLGVCCRAPHKKRSSICYHRVFQFFFLNRDDRWPVTLGFPPPLQVFDWCDHQMPSTIRNVGWCHPFIMPSSQSRLQTSFVTDVELIMFLFTIIRDHRRLLYLL